MKFSDLPPYTKETLNSARALRKEMTPAEWAVWNHLSDNKTGVKFRRQVPIGKYIVDFISLEVGLVVEIDGGQHYSVENKKYDLKRTEFFIGLGIKTIRFNNHEVSTNLDRVIESIMRIVNKLKG